MADNVTVDNVALTDYVVATDDDGVAQHQYVKLEFGVDNTQTKVSASNPLPVTGTALSGTIAISSIAAGSAFLGTVANAGTVAVSSIVSALPAGTNTLGTVAAITGPLPAGVNTLGTVAPVGTFTTKETRSSTGTMSHIASSSSAVGLLNTNASRLGFSIQNDATGNLYIGYGSNVSTTDYVARLTQYAYFEAPYNYTGTVCGLWSTVVASDGGARITEYS